MPKLYDREGVWYADTGYIDESGEYQRKQRSTRVKNDGTRQSERTAEIAARNLEASLAAGKNRVARGTTLKQAYALRLEERGLANGAQASLRIILEKSVHVLNYFGPTRDVGSFTDEDLKDYAKDARRGNLTPALHYPKGREPRAPGTVQREITELRCALRAAGVTPPAAPDLGVTYKPIELWFNSDASTKLIAELSEDRRDHAIVHRLAGARYSELYRIESFDLSRPRKDGPSLLRIRGTKTENDDDNAGSDRTVPMHPQVEEILRRRAVLCPSGPLFPDVWLNSNGNRDMNAAAKRAGLTFKGKASFNVLRASFCTELVLAGVPLKKVAYLMGHKTTRMVDRIYTRFFGAEVGVDLGDVLGAIVRPATEITAQDLIGQIEDPTRPLEPEID